MSKITGQPIVDADITNFPHTISYAIMYRQRIDSYKELTKDKRPPRDLWDKPHKLDKYFDEIFSVGGSEHGDAKQVLFDPDEIE